MKNIYLFVGNEELIIKNKIDTVITNAHPGPFNLTSYDMDLDKLESAINDCKTMPFMSDKKVVVIKRPTFLEKGSSNQNVLPLIDYLDNPSDNTILIIDATNINIDESKEISIMLRKKAEISETRDLSEVEMRGWLKRQFGVMGVEIEENAVELFFEYVGTNLVQAKTEVEKLLNYIGDRKIINMRDVASCVSEEGETNVFALTKAITTKDKNKIMEIYYSLLKSGNDQMKLLNLIYRSLKDSYTCLLLMEQGMNQASIASILNISPGRTYYIMKDAKNFTIESLRKMIKDIGDLDYKIKSGQIDKVSGLELFLFQI